MSSQVLTSTNRDAYLGELLDRVYKSTSPQLSSPAGREIEELRDRASSVVLEHTFPTTRDEAWRFTDISPLLQVNFQLPETSAIPSLPLSDIKPLIFSEAADSRLVFVNGVYAPQLSSVANIPSGLFVGNLTQLPENYLSRLPNYLGKQQGAVEVFTALNTAGFTDAAVVWVARNQIVETPIHLLFISTLSESPIISQPRCLVVAETNSQVTLVEDYLTISDWCVNNANPYFVNTVTEIWAEENAQVNHSRIQRDSKVAFHIGKTAVSQARYSRYTCNAINMGGKISRHNLEIFQTGEQTETTLNGLTMISGEQLADTHSEIVLNCPHSTTRQLQKNIASDRSHIVFNGRVFVAKAAQLTDAGQLNRNLLLSPKARVDTKPQLEIIADNVKCTHGATVSQLDDEEIFYLQSRGLDKVSAYNLLVDAFAAEIINLIPLTSVETMLSQCVACRAI
ncbi:Fe-S cluster assembly protein SufD [Planktothrix sp. FACHB-1355]|uniref:Fe-S cluster assembly protein SufD n=1 Tax=Aerosakkonema funiforme FACHB-1375 TaxID=2949571 RepID=A0A926V9M4_9CYAN|nr:MULTISPECIES: Fe-S cluster assembly protein SufD [Oscillatoriales]MBD2179818.1 Fe-S cluster assembly protein SufD [Aerosakkonema funiforme FACHB-1375]MBD3557921.1 Fe-S cluster assembly protein SufD [Planktothrix sp. FACHB-1355]